MKERAKVIVPSGRQDLTQYRSILDREFGGSDGWEVLYAPPAGWAYEQIVDDRITRWPRAGVVFIEPVQALLLAFLVNTGEHVYIIYRDPGPEQEWQLAEVNLP